MSGPPLTAGTVKRIQALFASVDDRELVAAALLEECGDNLPFLDRADSEDMDRIRFAVLKLSNGDLARFDKALSLARDDWRDLLMSAGFGEDVRAHQKWVPEDAGER